MLEIPGGSRARSLDFSGNIPAHLFGELLAGCSLSGYFTIRCQLLRKWLRNRAFVVAINFF
jgi:hypothetical protein